MSSGQSSENNYGPVMTFGIGQHWVGVPVSRVIRVDTAPVLWPVPLAQPNHAGLYDNGKEIFPVMRLETPETPETPKKQLTPTNPGDQLVAILRSRDQEIGLAFDNPGQIYHKYTPCTPSDAHSNTAETANMPKMLRGIGVQAQKAVDQLFWIIDTNQMWPDDESGPINPT
ncbi:hypothetical protein KAI87_05200 [Myxococcota bacterium]|nr:hypothetical protein [Myxococcota bacterium]